jgi:hypothetical protein
MDRLFPGRSETPLWNILAKTQARFNLVIGGLTSLGGSLMIKYAETVTGGLGKPALQSSTAVDVSPRYGENAFVGDTLCRKRAFL